MQPSNADKTVDDDEPSLTNGLDVELYVVLVTATNPHPTSGLIDGLRTAGNDAHEPAHTALGISFTATSEQSGESVIKGSDLSTSGVSPVAVLSARTTRKSACIAGLTVAAMFGTVVFILFLRFVTSE